MPRTKAEAKKPKVKKTKPKNGAGFVVRAEPIELGPQYKDGVHLKWDWTHVCELLTLGQRFIIYGLTEYNSIYSLMERNHKSDTHKLKRRAFRKGKYLIAWLPNDREIEEVERDPQYRYGMWRDAAKTIHEGGQRWFPTRDNCKRVSYAWRQIYSQEERRGWTAKTHKLDGEDYKALVAEGVADDLDLDNAEGYGYVIFLMEKS